MSRAQRIPASEKAPEDFLPIPLRPIEKRVCSLKITRKDGREESHVFILRPGDMAEMVDNDGVTV